jgi:uncharacterized membrane protein
LQGGGVGLIYLTLYAAFALYALLSASGAFTLMLLVVMVAGWLGHRQDAQVLAVMGAIGGFAAPILASTGAGNHLLLFSYYALLNVGVLGLAFNNTWRVLNFTGFVATFVISAVWGYQFDDVEHFATAEPFLILFFVMYLSIAIAFAILRSIRLQDPLDSTLVFGTPLVAFELQSRLLGDSEYGLACSAVILALVYAAATWFLLRRADHGLRILAQAFAAPAVGFATLAIPLALDVRWSSASWALEGAALLWVGWRQRRRLARIAGALLQLVAGATWLWSGVFMNNWQLGDRLGTVMLARAGLLGSIVLSLPNDDDETSSVTVVLRIALGAWGLLWGGGSLVALRKS